jgi:glycosyltransferase involved in cell wall biosynthesis
LAERRYRVLVVSAHPVQYTAPYFRQLTQHPKVDLLVAYCTLRGAEAGHDPEFGATVQWDVPLLDGYSWVQIPNSGSGDESFFGLTNPGLWKLICDGKFDAVFCYTGYIRASFWIAYFASRRAGAGFIFGTDASSLGARRGASWKYQLKKLLWPRLFSVADQVNVPSNPSRALMLSLGIPAERVSLTPYAVDNDWWLKQAEKVDRQAVRAEWGATDASCVILFCAKLQPWKRPMDLLQAFVQANVPDVLLVFAGEGPQRQDLEREVARLGIAERVRFLGFVNQSQLPAVYTAADLMVLPSEYEPFAVVVNEASCCECPVVASDNVGAASDLVAPVDPGLIFPSTDVAALARLLTQLCGDRERLRGLGRAARERMKTWSLRETVAGTVEAIERAVAHVRNGAAEIEQPTASGAVESAPGELQRGGPD